MNSLFRAAFPACVALGVALWAHAAIASGDPWTVAAQFHPSPKPNAGVSAHPGPFHGPVVYAAATSRGVVNVYRGGRKLPTRALYSFSLDPGVENSLHIDGKGNLFFADSYSTWVYEYAPGTNTPLKSFPTSETPFNIDVRGDTLYVFQSQSEGGDASVQIYEKGHTQPDRALTDGAIEAPSGLAVDKAGNVFVAYFGAGFSSGIGEFVGGKMPMVPLSLSGASLPVALAIDAAGNLLVDSEGDGYVSTILIYAPGETTPRRKITNLPALYQFSLTADGKYFYAGDSGQVSTFQMYTYPKGKLVYQFSDPNAYVGFAGIAASPPLPVGTW